MNKRELRVEIKKLRKKEKSGSLTTKEKARLDTLKERGWQVGVSW